MFRTMRSTGVSAGLAIAVLLSGCTTGSAPAPGSSATSAAPAAPAAAPAATAAPAAPTTAPAAAKPTAPANKLKVSIMVGGLDKIIYLPAMLTKQLGYFDEAGLDLELLDEPAGVSAETAMLSGQVNGVVGFYDHNIDLQGLGKQTMSVVQLNGVPGEVELVSTKKVDEIKSPADFKDRNLGVTGIGSSTYFLTQFLGTKSGVPIDSMHPIAVGAGNTFIAAIQQGSIDAGMTTEPTISRMLKSGEARVLVDMRTPETTRAALGVDYPAACVYMTADWVAGHKEETQRIANAFVKTLKWIKTHSAAEIADKMPPDYYAGDNELYVKALDSSLGMFTPDGKMPPQGPAGVLQVLSSFDKNVQGKTIDLAKTYTTEFVDKAP